MSLQHLQKRLVGRVGRGWRHAFDRVRASVLTTYADASGARPQNVRFGFLDPSFMNRLAALSPWHPGLIARLADDAMCHRFDLLGSGPVVVSHGMKCAGLAGVRYDPVPSPDVDADGLWLGGLINRSNVAEARRIWRCIDGDYTPIDWQLDFKSGYRWSERVWHSRIRFGHVRGVDVKVPWELARLQHLPALALAAHYAEAGHITERRPQDFVREAKNQLLDFIASNPPGFGVNWACAMDVAIRVANMVLTHDMMAATGIGLGEEFEAIFADSVLAHGRHIARNMEWSPVFRGNHYLANVAGLLFAAAYLPRSRETDVWLCFGTEELLGELRYQFHDDGSNFEASTCYHRLSAEIVLWAFALLDNLPDEKLAAFNARVDWAGPLPPRRRTGPLELHVFSDRGRGTPIAQWCRERLAAMARFTQCLTRPDGLVVQFGDNDSGRFILVGTNEQHLAVGDPNHPAWSLDHQSLVSGIDAYLGRGCADAGSAILAEFAGWNGLQGEKTSSETSADIGVGRVDDWDRLLALSERAEPESSWRMEFGARSGLQDKVMLHSFPGMGCFVFSGPNLFLAIRCGEIGICGLGAHAHCDQLAIELVVNGETMVRDPGSYIYTALPELRNQYRSVKAHHAPRHLGHEPGNLSLGIFDLRGSAVGECLYFGREGFAGLHRGYGFDIYRIVQLSDDRVVVIDFSPDGHRISDPRPDKIAFSAGYGRTEERPS